MSVVYLPIGLFSGCSYRASVSADSVPHSRAAVALLQRSRCRRFPPMSHTLRDLLHRITFSGSYLQKCHITALGILPHILCRTKTAKQAVGIFNCSKHPHVGDEWEQNRLNEDSIAYAENNDTLFCVVHYKNICPSHSGVLLWDVIGYWPKLTLLALSQSHRLEQWLIPWRDVF